MYNLQGLENSVLSAMDRNSQNWQAYMAFTNKMIFAELGGLWTQNTMKSVDTPQNLQKYLDFNAEWMSYEQNVLQKTHIIW